MSKTSAEASREGSAVLRGDDIKPQPVVQSAPTPEYPTGFKFGITLFALFISLFCVALDSTIIATAIPRITDHFHALQDVGWYGSSYLLTKCGMYTSWVISVELLLTPSSISTPLWQDLPLLQSEMDFPRRPVYLRDWLRPLRSCHIVSNADRWCKSSLVQPYRDVVC
jgi:hypothetical protein